MANPECEESANRPCIGGCPQGSGYKLGDMVLIFSQSASDWKRGQIIKVNGWSVTVEYGDRQRVVDLKDANLSDYLRSLERSPERVPDHLLECAPERAGVSHGQARQQHFDALRNPKMEDCRTKMEEKAPSVEEVLVPADTRIDILPTPVNRGHLPFSLDDPIAVRPTRPPSDTISLDGYPEERVVASPSASLHPHDGSHIRLTKWAAWGNWKGGPEMVQNGGFRGTRPELPQRNIIPICDQCTTKRRTSWCLH